jgi:hypothetical protein
VGLDTAISGLTPGKRYTITAWSFDSGSAGIRTSDWSVLGLGGPQFAVNNYAFDGSTLPMNDASNQFVVTAYANESGHLVLRGRPNAAGSLPQVFLNGLTLDELPDAAVAPTSKLAIDFNDRAGRGAANTFSGFSEFVLAGTEGTAQTTSSRTFGAYTVAITSVGGTLDDRLRTTPIKNGPFTDSLLVKDFIFTGAVTGGQGFDVRVAGLVPNQSYLLELWSFDALSSGTLRSSDWTVNGSILWDDYGFNGANTPATTDDTKMAGAFTANPSDE